MDFHPDVLERLGKTPRELGALHLHVEPIVRRDDGQAIARVWLQAAFSPLSPAPRLRVLDASFSLPELAEGQVMRGELPLAIPAGVTELLFSVECPVLEKAERCRQAWKLLDTIEVAKERDLKVLNADTGIRGGLLLANALTLPMGVAVVPLAGLGRTISPSMQDALAQKVHKAKEGPGGFVARVFPGEATPVATEAWTEVWRPGAPLPEPVVEVSAEFQAVLHERTAAAPAERFEAPAPAPAGETPWAVAKTLLDQGFPKLRIIDRLVEEKGLSRKDAELLLAEVPEPVVSLAKDGAGRAAGSDVAGHDGVNLGPVLGVGMVFLGPVLAVAGGPVLALVGLGLFLAGVVRAGRTFGESPKPPVVDLASLATLPADSPVQRCGLHSHLASLGACPRCGAFACRACAPFPGFPTVAVCLACDALPATRQERLRKAQRWSALAVAGYSLAWGGAAAYLASEGVPWRAMVMVYLAGAIAQALLLAGVQWLLGHAWPSLLALASNLFALVSIDSILWKARVEGTAVLLALWWLGLSVAVFTLAGNVRGRRKAVGEAAAQLATAR